MTVAGSDSGGGAGIQADLKTFAAHGVYGTSVITAVTAQNTVAVTGVLELESELVERQMDAVLTDIGADAVKTGMLASGKIIEAVARKIREHQVTNLVVDPVMVAKSGHHLLADEAVDAMRRLLIPLARVVTPNLPEAEALVGFPVHDAGTREEAARVLVDLGARAALVKGGHGSETDAVDLLFESGSRRLSSFRAPRVETRNTHGTGCTLSAAIAARLALGDELEAAVSGAKSYLTEALLAGINVGRGHGPVDHFVGCRLRGRQRPISPGETS
jgi:hydroxymethylpyrimidine/phosphomethylpyrimidine kinase